MPATISGWDLDVQRGPGWLVVRPARPDSQLADCCPLAEQLWSMMERHFVYRLVLNLDEVPTLNSHLIGQMLLLYRRIRDRDGVLRLCGLSGYNQRVLQLHGLLDRFPAYENLEEAVLGALPAKPR